MPIPNESVDHYAYQWAMGNEDAARFLVNVIRMVRLADDLADGDSKAPVADTANLLIRAWLEHATNPFFQAHSGALGASMMNAVLLWEKSEEWRRDENRKTRMFGFVCRETIEQVAHTVAFITGGYEHAKNVAQEIHKVSHQGSAETFEEWEAE